MIRHVVMFTWKDGATPEQIQAVGDGLAALPGQIPHVSDYSFGPDAALREGNWDFVVVGDFDSADDYLAYANDDAHVALVRDVIAPIAAQRASVQYEVG